MTRLFIPSYVLFFKDSRAEGKLKNQIKDHLSVGHSGQKDNYLEHLLHACQCDAVLLF